MDKPKPWKRVGKECYCCGHDCNMYTWTKSMGFVLLCIRCYNKVKGIAKAQ